MTGSGSSSTTYADLELKFDPETLEVKPDNLEAFAIADQVLGQDFRRRAAGA